MTFRPGTLVRVRSRDDILASLDTDGSLERMPFMPEMLRLCGEQFRVSAVAHKTCDPVFKTGGRRLNDAVHLDHVRCDGSAHGGCQAGCSLFWKTAWLQPVDEAPAAATPRVEPRVTEDTLQAATTLPALPSGETRYSCQATRLLEATTLLPWWDVRQYWQDVWSGNVPVARAARVLALASIRSLKQLGVGHRAFGWVYRQAHALLYGVPAPLGVGRVPAGQPTPAANDGIRAGEIVRVRTHDDILGTLDRRRRNRGLGYDEEMALFCGGEYRVAGRVERIIDEATGKMLQMKQPCITLEGVYCKGEYSAKRLLCPRAYTVFWRENWLERVDDPT